MDFEWNDDKAANNLKKHGVRFSEAVTVWLDDSALEMPDPEHSKSEERWVRIGFSRKANLLVVVYCEKIENEVVRIISARPATRKEEKQYHSR
jgi:uncharacterized DUF497 family protein